MPHARCLDGHSRLGKACPLPEKEDDDGHHNDDDCQCGLIIIWTNHCPHPAVDDAADDKDDTDDCEVETCGRKIFARPPPPPPPRVNPRMRLPRNPN